MRGRRTGAAPAGGYPLPRRARRYWRSARCGDRPLLLCGKACQARGAMHRHRHPRDHRQFCGGSHPAGHGAGLAQRGILQLPQAAPGHAGGRGGILGQRFVHELPPVTGVYAAGRSGRPHRAEKAAGGRQRRYHGRIGWCAAVLPRVFRVFGREHPRAYFQSQH